MRPDYSRAFRVRLPSRRVTSILVTHEHVRRERNRDSFFKERDAAAQRQSWAYFTAKIDGVSRLPGAAIYAAWQSRLHARLRRP